MASTFTLKDIAKQVGVTIPTVSKVLNKSASTVRVSSKVRKQILDTAHTLGYQPNRLARSLRTQKSASLGLIVGGLVTPARVRCMERLEELARGRGFNIMIGSSEGQADIESTYVSEFLSRQVDGLIIASRGHDYDNQHLQELAVSRFPTVAIEVEVPGIDIAQVIVDIKDGAKLATEHLLKIGRTPVLMINKSPNLSITNRIEGFTQAYQQAGRSDAEQNIYFMGEGEIDAGWSWNNPWTTIGRDSCLKLLREKPNVDAIFASNDQVAMGVLRALNIAEKKVPQEVAVAGMDGLPETECYSVPLTTVAHPQELIAEQAMKLISEMLENRDIPRRSIKINPELIVRESTAGKAGYKYSVYN